MARGDGEVYLRGRVWWVSLWKDGVRIRESAKTTNEEQARRYRTKRMKQLGSPTFVTPAAERVKLATLLDGVVRNYEINGKRSLRDVRRLVRDLKQAFGPVRAKDVTSAAVAQYIDTRRAAGVKPATVNRSLSALKRAFNLGVKGDLIPRAMVPTISLLSEAGNERQGFVEPATFDAIVTHLADEDVADLVRFLYACGWRRGEAVALEWRMVQLQREHGQVVGGTIVLPGTHTKNGRARTLPLDTSPDLLAVMTRRQARRSLVTPFVFHRHGRPIKDFRRRWRQACAAASAAGLLTHDLRRSAIRHLTRAGVPEAVAMKISGHQTASVFRRYDIASDRDVADALHAMSEYRRQVAARVAPLPVRQSN